MAGLKVVGLGGSLREASRSRAAIALLSTARPRLRRLSNLVDLGDLGLPMNRPDLEADPPADVTTMLETCYEAGRMLWSDPMYNGSVSGPFNRGSWCRARAAAGTARAARWWLEVFRAWPSGPPHRGLGSSCC